MMDATQILDAELTALRGDQAFMTKQLQRQVICDMLGLGTYCDHEWRVYEWRVYKDGKKASWRSRDYIARSRDEVLSTVDMRSLLLALFWTLQSRRPKDLGTLVDIGDDAFWLEFLHLAQAAKWRPPLLWQRVLDSTSPHIPAQVRVAAWMYYLTMAPKSYKGSRFPQAAFERLDHVQFDATQKTRWDNLVGFGLEALYKKQFNKVMLAMDMTATELKDWLTCALDRIRPELVAYLLDKHGEADLGMSYRDILRYVVANIHGEVALQLIRRLEELSPGICVSYRDRRGHNLLWYAASCWQLRSTFAHPYTECGQPRDQSMLGRAKKSWDAYAEEHGKIAASNADNSKLLAMLIRYGVSPFEANEIGVTFRDLDDFGRLIGQRWAFTRLRQDTPGFDDAAYWGLDPQKEQ